MKKKAVIAVDADDVLFDENNAIRLFHNERFGTNHQPADYSVDGEWGFFWEPIWQTERAETIRRYEEFIEYKLSNNLPPLPGALKVLLQLKDNFELVVVTARDERSVRMTHDALSEHYPQIFKGVHFVPLWGGGAGATKAVICSEIGASYLIDDSFENCALAAEAGVTALLFGGYGWNRSKPLSAGIVRLNSWPEVKKYFDGRVTA